MNKPVSLYVALVCAVPLSLLAEGDSPGEQIAGVNAEIAAAQQLNLDLKTQLAAKETEAAALREKLKHIEDQIEALKK